MLAILGGIMLGSFVTEPLDYGFDYSPVEQVSTQQIEHSGYSSGDRRQVLIQKAYDLGGIDFILMVECESGWNPRAKGDSGRSYGLCQMNSRRHNIPKEYYESAEYQVDYCYNKRKGGTKFYGPQRKIKGQTCSNYVKSRFIIK